MYVISTAVCLRGSRAANALHVRQRIVRNSGVRYTVQHRGHHRAVNAGSRVPSRTALRADVRHVGQQHDPKHSTDNTSRRFRLP